MNLTLAKSALTPLRFGTGSSCDTLGRIIPSYKASGDDDERAQKNELLDSVVDLLVSKRLWSCFRLDITALMGRGDPTELMNGNPLGGRICCYVLRGDLDIPTEELSD